MNFTDPLLRPSMVQSPHGNRFRVVSYDDKTGLVELDTVGVSHSAFAVPLAALVESGYTEIDSEGRYVIEDASRIPRVTDIIPPAVDR